MMSKKVFIGILVIGILASSGFGLYYWQSTNKSTRSPEVFAHVPPSPAPEELLEWKDQAGFSFSYPKSLKSDIHEEDEENYAHIEFTHPDHQGQIIIWAKDLPAGKAGTTADINTWIKSEKTLASGVILDTTFADMDGKKVLLSIPKKKVITAAVTDAIIFYVEGEFEDSDYWTQTYDTITSTFAFTTDTSTVSQEEPSEGGTEEITIDEEEVLE